MALEVDVMKRSFLVSLVLAVASLAPSAQIGAGKLDEVTGGLVGPLPPLGYPMTAIGDLDGNGVVDLVEGLPTDGAAGTDHGGVLVIFLRADATAAGQRRINELTGGLVASLP